MKFPLSLALLCLLTVLPVLADNGEQDNSITLAYTLTNAAKTALAANDPATARRYHAEALAAVRNLPAASSKAAALLALGRIAQALNQTEQAFTLYREAQTLAQTLAEPRTVSFAQGYLGELYAAQNRRDEALQLTRQAIFSAQQAATADALYRWQWQAGRLLRDRGDIMPAIASYRQAVYQLQTIRQELGQVSFRDSVGPLFFELADLLLRQAATMPASTARQALLLEARDTVEKVKAAELTDYFQDNCVLALQARITGIDNLPPHTAALYPIPLPDRLELLLSLPDGIRQFTVPVGTAALTETVREFRSQLETRTAHHYLPHAQTLYQWLIAPLMTALADADVDTLVFVPDGALRTIPLAALHDGQRFLVEQFALATTPGLTLTDLRPLTRSNVRLLLSGLTESVQNFPPLPYVNEEIEEIQSLYGGTVLENEEFVIPRVEQALATTAYRIVHIASHGQFAGNVNDTFLLTYDGKLTLDRLEEVVSLSKYRDQPLELLTLSACQTAAGDDRAALGLAGVAVKAGARSALASLWFINDAASKDLVTDFYDRLQQPQLSKAQALQQAQLALLTDRRYRHPSYWAPFLLIGSWL